jgi:hypothetical protein
LANWGIEVAAVDQAAPPSAEEDLKWAKRFFQPQDQEPELSVTLTAKGHRTLQAVQKALRKPKSTTVEAKLSSNAMVIAGRLLVPNAPDKILSAKETEDWLAQGANQKEVLTFRQAIDFRNGGGVTLHAEPTATFALTDLPSLGRADDDYGVPMEYQTRWMDEGSQFRVDAGLQLAENPSTPSIATNATREGEVVRLDGTLTWPPQEGQPDSGRTETFTVYIPPGQAALLNIPGRPGFEQANFEVLLRVR